MTWAKITADCFLGIALTLISILLTIHNLYPMARSHTAPFFLLSYYQPSQGVYVQGWDDIYFVIGSIVCFTAYRAIAIEWIFMPLAERAGLKKKACIRFAEQGWQLVYFGVFWSLGMVCREFLLAPGKVQLMKTLVSPRHFPILEKHLGAMDAMAC